VTESPEAERVTSCPCRTSSSQRTLTTASVPPYRGGGTVSHRGASCNILNTNSAFYGVGITPSLVTRDVVAGVGALRLNGLIAVGPGELEAPSLEPVARGRNYEANGPSRIDTIIPVGARIWLGRTRAGQLQREQNMRALVNTFTVTITVVRFRLHSSLGGQASALAPHHRLMVYDPWPLMATQKARADRPPHLIGVRSVWNSGPAQAASVTASSRTRWLRSARDRPQPSVRPGSRSESGSSPLVSEPGALTRTIR
jgi:hypothetical protein